MPGLNAEGTLHHAYVAERVGEHLAVSAGRIAVRMDALRHTHERVRAALQDSDSLMELPDGADLDEEIETGAAMAEHAHREANAIADVARRLAAFARLPSGDAEREMVDVNACVGDVVAATEAERAARVSQRLEISRRFSARRPSPPAARAGDRERGACGGGARGACGDDQDRHCGAR